MPSPLMAQRGPHPVDLAPGEYLWCARGHSRTPPFRDGTHDLVE